MKKSILSILFVAIVSFTFATNVIPVQEAQRVSSNFLREATGRIFNEADITLESTVYTTNGDVAYYQFQIQGKGFILVSGTDLMNPVLGYSLSNDFVAENDAQGNYFGMKFQEEAAQVIANPSLAKNHQNSWNHFRSKNFVPSSAKNTEGVQPLITTAWSQGEYYNALCPYNGKKNNNGDALDAAGRDFRALVGCVGVNIANLLFYHRFPESGVSGVSYIPFDPDYGHTYPRQTVNFATSTYNYYAMSANSLNSYVNELAKLLYHSGVSAKMSYGIGGSSSNSVEAHNALTTYWKMNPGAQIFSKADVTVSQFTDSMRAQLDRNLPLYFSGTIDGEAGHAFMIDGYIVVDGTTYFHANFGWNGYKNGYYPIGDIDGYNADENILLNVFPDPADSTAFKPATSIDTITASIGSISDGSGYFKYAPNSNRVWVVEAPHATKYYIDFTKIKTEADADLIKIYKGTTPSAANLVGTYSGNYLMKGATDGAGHAQANFEGLSLPSTITVNNSAFCVEFTSNGNDVTDYGFVLEYEASLNHAGIPTCNQNAQLPTIVGVISDKGLNPADEDMATPYVQDKWCRWTGNFTFLTGTAMSFTQFDLGAGDYVDIINCDDPDSLFLVKRFDLENTPDGAFNVPGNKFQVIFVSDNWKEGTGFKLHYFGISSINETELTDVNVYPNPATNNVNVAISVPAEQKVTFQIVDMAGRIIQSESMNVAGEYTYSTNISNLATGIYMMRVQTESGKSIHKFIVE